MCLFLQLPPPPSPDFNLDSALHELGMLATRTDSRQEYLEELTKPKQLLNMLSMNTRYVSNVSMGFRVRPTAPRVRHKPYQLSKREERYRTRSENNDNDIDDSERSSFITSMIDQLHSLTELTQLKKAKSLESIAMENKAGLNSTEVEVVSDSIQNLKVGEDNN